MTSRKALADEEIERKLAEVPGWSRRGAVLSRTFAHSYDECVHLAMYVAVKAGELDHHPDIAITYGRITFTLTTHSAGEHLTEADFVLAGQIDALAAALGAEPA